MFICYSDGNIKSLGLMKDKLTLTSDCLHGFDLLLHVKNSPFHKNKSKQ